MRSAEDSLAAMRVKDDVSTPARHRSVVASAEVVEAPGRALYVLLASVRSGMGVGVLVHAAPSAGTCASTATQSAQGQDEGGVQPEA